MSEAVVILPGIQLSQSLSDLRGATMDVITELGDQVAVFLRPSRTEVIRAKKAMLRILDDGRPHWSSRLVEAAVTELGAPERLDRVQLAFNGPIRPEEVGRDHAVV